MIRICFQKVMLENYRNFSEISIDSQNSSVILLGNNGIGKTNILESLSLFFPGRGIRSSKWSEIVKSNLNDNQELQPRICKAYTSLDSKLGLASLSNNFCNITNKRNIEFNGSKIPSSDLSKLSSVIWITPQMDGIFLFTSQERRKFLDRIVYSFDPNHATNVNKYEYYITERNKVLAQYDITFKVLDEIEHKISEIILLIANSRNNAIKILNSSMNRIDTNFPKAILKISGELEDMFNSNYCIELKDIQSKLHSDRIKDKIASRTHFGTHRSDFMGYYYDHKPAKFCSTGEQKAILISIILAQALALETHCNVKPVLLLDEVFVHLDEMKKDALNNFLFNSGNQVWITSTDKESVGQMSRNATVISLT
jgi:DNA replication and repair protein RecF